MKRTEIGIPRKLLFLYRVLILTAILLVLVLIGGTIYGLSRRGAVPSGKPGAAPSGANTGAQTAAQRTAPASVGYFTGIGRIRAESAGSPSATVILSIVFPYDPGDQAFSEELAGRLREFRELASDLVASRSAEQLGSLGEEGIKKELLRRYNALLRLGKIETLYFSDFLILE